MNNVTPFTQRKPPGFPDDLPPPLPPVEDDVPDPDVPRGGSAKDDPRTRFKIDVNFPSIRDMSAVAWKAIVATNTPPRLFSLGGRPVRIVGGTDGVPAATQDLTLDMITGASARSAYWYKYTNAGYIEQFPAEKVMRDLLADANPPLPKLTRITRAPMFGPTGSLSVTPGYDPATGQYFDAGNLRVTAPPARPTEEEIAAAVDFLLTEFLGDFPFADQASRAHTLNLILNPFVRSMVTGPTPLFSIEAPAAGTGKGLLAHVAMIPALGAAPTIMPPSDNEEEMRKRLMATVMNLPDAILLDNVAEGLDSPSLSSLLTAPGQWTDRVLGRSENRTVPFTATFMATGNNPSKSTEMARRIITIRIDSKTERPENRRNFRHKRIERWAMEHRTELIGACLTIVQGWISRGMPLSDHVLGSYESWAEIHGAILDVAGIPGFLANKGEGDVVAVSEDAAWADFCNRWFAVHGGGEVVAGEIFPIAKTTPEFPLDAAKSEMGQRQSFGGALRKNRDRIYDGLRIVQVTGKKRGNALCYRLIDMR